MSMIKLQFALNKARRENSDSVVIDKETAERIILMQRAMDERLSFCYDIMTEEQMNKVVTTYDFEKEKDS